MDQTARVDGYGIGAFFLGFPHAFGSTCRLDDLHAADTPEAQRGDEPNVGIVIDEEDLHDRGTAPIGG